MKNSMLSDLASLRSYAVELLTIIYSTQSYPATATSGAVIPDKATATQALKDTLASISSTQAAILNIDSILSQMNSTYKNPAMQTIIPDVTINTLGYTKRFDIASNKYIYTDANGTIVANPAPPSARSYTQRAGGRKKKGGSRREKGRKGATR